MHPRYKNDGVGTKLDLIIPLLEAFDNLPAEQKKGKNNFLIQNNRVYDGTRSKAYMYEVAFEKPTTLCPN